VEELLRKLNEFIPYEGEAFGVFVLSLMDAYISRDNPPGVQLCSLVHKRALHCISLNNEIATESLAMTPDSQTTLLIKLEKTNVFQGALLLNDSANIFRSFNGIAANIMEVLQSLQSVPDIEVRIGGVDFKLYCTFVFLNRKSRDRHFLENHLNFACVSSSLTNAGPYRPERRVVFYHCRYRGPNCPKGNRSKQNHCDALIVEHQFAEKETCN
jgi:hypothetical protein